jgi:hypothetical protein
MRNIRRSADGDGDGPRPAPAVTTATPLPSSSSASSSALMQSEEGRAAPPLGVVLTHVCADFDTLSSAVGLAKLRDSREGAACTFVLKP